MASLIHASSQTNRPFTVLCVDDFPGEHKLSNKALHLLGFRCDFTVDGKTAVEMAKNQHFDLILMDIQLPAMDGVEATQLIRQDEAEYKLKKSMIFGLTSRVEYEDLKEYHAVGMDGCIAKGSVRLHAVQTAISATKSSPPGGFIFINDETYIDYSFAEGQSLTRQNANKIKLNERRRGKQLTSETQNGVALMNNVGILPKDLCHMIAAYCILEENGIEKPNFPCLASQLMRKRRKKPVKDVTLLVDDSKLAQKMASKQLSRVGWGCHMSGNGEMAVKMAKKTPYPVVLMDVKLGEQMDGCEATKLIRSSLGSASSRSVILGLTGSCALEDLHRYSNSGMNGCLQKGCHLGEAMRNAVEMIRQNPKQFIYVNQRNVESFPLTGTAY